MLSIHLFGKLRVQADGQPLGGLDARRVQELLVYLLLNRDRPHPRDFLADLLWGEGTSTQVRKGLRQALWKLQSVVGMGADAQGGGLLKVDSGYVQLSGDAPVWLDVAEFETAWALAQGKPGAALDPDAAAALKRAIGLYGGDLLDGWYQDWCLFERERLRNMYLDMLGKLMTHAEAHGDYEAGLEYGTTVLRMDRTRERTHRAMMRLHYLDGHRVRALRQYEQCVAALRDEIGVAPARRTVLLHEQIRDDALTLPPGAAVVGARAHDDEPASATPAHLLEQLRHMRGLLDDLQLRVDRQIRALEGAPRA